MPEHFRGDLRVRTIREVQRRAVPQVVKTDRRDAGALHRSVERAADRAR